MIGSSRERENPLLVAGFLALSITRAVVLARVREGA
jgi:hypothetical protein